MASDEVVLYDQDLAREIFKSRRSGKSITDISEESGMSTAEVVHHYRTYMLNLAVHYGEETRKVSVQMELERLDSLQASLWDDAINGDFKAVETVLKIMDRRAKLLNLDAITGTDPQTVQNILVLGTNQKDFIDALNHGRQNLTGSDSDDKGEQKELS